MFLVSLIKHIIAIQLHKVLPLTGVSCDMCITICTLWRRGFYDAEKQWQLKLTVDGHEWRTTSEHPVTAGGEGGREGGRR